MLNRSFYTLDEVVSKFGGDFESVRQAFFRRELEGYLELWHVSAYRATAAKEDHRDLITGMARALIDNFANSPKPGELGEYALNGWFRLSSFDAEIFVSRGGLGQQPFLWPAGASDPPNRIRQWFHLKSGELDELKPSTHLWLSAEQVDAYIGKVADEPTGTISPWPWGAHETQLLRHLAAAANKFWRLYDPADATTAPKNDDVAAWLKEQGVSERNAQVMATILRADNLPTGPRK